MLVMMRDIRRVRVSRQLRVISPTTLTSAVSVWVFIIMASAWCIYNMLSRLGTDGPLPAMGLLGREDREMHRAKPVIETGQTEPHTPNRAGVPLQGRQQARGNLQICRIGAFRELLECRLQKRSRAIGFSPGSQKRRVVDRSAQ